MQVTWEKQTHKYSNGEWARVGKVVVGSAGYVSGSKGDPAKYACNCLLPGIKQVDEKYETIDGAKARLERMVAAWASWTQQSSA